MVSFHKSYKSPASSLPLHLVFWGAKVTSEGTSTVSTVLIQAMVSCTSILQWYKPTSLQQWPPCILNTGESTNSIHNETIMKPNQWISKGYPWRCNKHDLHDFKESYLHLPATCFGPTPTTIAAELKLLHSACQVYCHCVNYWDVFEKWLQCEWSASSWYNCVLKVPPLNQEFQSLRSFRLTPVPLGRWRHCNTSPENHPLAR